MIAATMKKTKTMCGFPVNGHKKMLIKMYAEWNEQLDKMKKGYKYTRPIILDDGAYFAGVFSPDN